MQIFRSPDLQGDPLYIAGVPSVDVILRRPKQVSVDDFTGCMRNIYVNGYHVDKSTALSSHLVNGGCAKAAGCSSSTCKNGQCVDDWKGFQCQCKTGFSGNTCTAGKLLLRFLKVEFKACLSHFSKLRSMQNAPIVDPKRFGWPKLTLSSQTYQRYIIFLARSIP